MKKITESFLSFPIHLNHNLFVSYVISARVISVFPFRRRKKYAALTENKLKAIHVKVGKKLTGSSQSRKVQKLCELLGEQVK